MNKTKLTIRLPRALLEEVRRYARENNTTPTRLVLEYLRQLALAYDPLVDGPIVRRLSGSLEKAASIEDYKTYLAEKYGNWA